MTKAELIEKLIRLSKKSKATLTKMKKAELESLLNELESEEPEEEPDNTGAENKGSTEVIPTEDDQEEWKEVKFLSFCGFPFDPNEKSECWTMCKKDSPDEFQKCLTHFKETPAPTPKKKARKKTAGAGKNRFGRRIGSQASLIEKALDEEEPMTIKELAEYADCTVGRVRRHFRRLIYTEQVAKVLISPDDKVFFLSRFPDKEGISVYPKYRGEVDNVEEARKALTENTEEN